MTFFGSVKYFFNKARYRLSVIFFGTKYNVNDLIIAKQYKDDALYDVALQNLNCTNENFLEAFEPIDDWWWPKIFEDALPTLVKKGCMEKKNPSNIDLKLYNSLLQKINTMENFKSAFKYIFDIIRKDDCDSQATKSYEKSLKTLLSGFIGKKMKTILNVIETDEARVHRIGLGFISYDSHQKYIEKTLAIYMQNLNEHLYLKTSNEPNQELISTIGQEILFYANKIKNNFIANITDKTNLEHVLNLLVSVSLCGERKITSRKISCLLLEILSVIKHDNSFFITAFDIILPALEKNNTFVEKPYCSARIRILRSFILRQDLSTLENVGFNRDLSNLLDAINEEGKIGDALKTIVEPPNNKNNVERFRLALKIFGKKYLGAKDSFTLIKYLLSFEEKTSFADDCEEKISFADGCFACALELLKEKIDNRNDEHCNYPSMIILHTLDTNNEYFIDIALKHCNDKLSLQSRLYIVDSCLDGINEDKDPYEKAVANLELVLSYFKNQFNFDDDLNNDVRLLRQVLQKIKKTLNDKKEILPNKLKEHFEQLEKQFSFIIDNWEKQLELKNQVAPVLFAKPTAYNQFSNSNNALEPQFRLSNQ